MPLTLPEPIETFLMRFGFDYDAVDAASPAAGADESGWMATHAFVADGLPILAVVPRGQTVDAGRLRTLAAAHDLRPATEAELAEHYPESDPGAMPPLGPLYGQRVFVDEALAARQDVHFTAGRRGAAIRMRYGDFAELVHPVVGRVAVRPSP